jgi:hypothetical protein
MLPFLVVQTSQERNLGIYFDVRLHSCFGAFLE